MAIRFSKMHGAGNDFVLIDLRHGQPAPDAALVRAMGNPHTGVGFDQLLSIESSDRADCVARYRIWNSDGSLAQQCGNGARCVAAWLIRDRAASPPRFRLDSPAGVIEVGCLAEGRFELDMGRPHFEPTKIPLAINLAADSYAAEVAGESIAFGAASMGNPHALLEVDDINVAPVETMGPALQASGLFPESVNVGFAQVVARDEIRLRVFERGAGETMACGSGACAAVAILAKQGKVDPQVAVHLPGGRLDIRWTGGDASIRMAGPAEFVFEGEWLQ